ncbi:hypothetical protein WMF31_27890 [Sorangium sp. So ce1036]|uniref:hypothetical protein n=1 Tax=Sorangium sp. So ce1036 TaxID=3133328 RepID=UPI003F06E234
MNPVKSVSVSVSVPVSVEGSGAVVPGGVPPVVLLLQAASATDAAIAESASHLARARFTMIKVTSLQRARDRAAECCHHVPSRLCTSGN